MKFTATHLVILLVASVAAFVSLVLTGKVAIPPDAASAVMGAFAGFVVGLLKVPPASARAALGLPAVTVQPPESP